MNCRRRVAGQRVVVAAGREELELPRHVVVALGVAPLEEEPLDLVRRVGDRAVLRVQLLGVDPAAASACRRGRACRRAPRPGRRPAPCRGRTRRPAASRTTDQSIARRRSDSACCEKPRIDDPSNVRLSGRRQQELLVVVEHVEAALEVGEADRHRLDALLVPQVPLALLADAVGRHPVEPLALGLEVHLLELVVGNLQEVPKRGFFHDCLILKNLPI